MTTTATSYRPGVDPAAATVWPTYTCGACGYRQGPVPDDESADEMIRVIEAHGEWCPERVGA